MAKNKEEIESEKEESEQLPADSFGQLKVVLGVRAFQTAITLFLVDTLRNNFIETTFTDNRTTAEIDISKVVETVNHVLVESKSEKLSEKAIEAAPLNILGPNARINKNGDKSILTVTESDLGVFFAGLKKYYKFRKSEQEVLGIKSKIRVKNPFDM